MNSKENKFEQLIADLDSVESKVADLMNALHESEERRFDLEKNILQLRKENELYRIKYEQIVKDSASAKADGAKQDTAQEVDREKYKAKLSTIITRLDGFLKDT